MCQNNWSPSSLQMLRIFGDQQNTHRVSFLDRFHFQVKAKSLNAEIFNMTCMPGSWSPHLSRCSDPAQCIATTKLSWQLIVRSATSPPCPSSSLHAAMADIMLNKYQLDNIYKVLFSAYNCVDNHWKIEIVSKGIFRIFCGDG